MDKPVEDMSPDELVEDILNYIRQIRAEQEMVLCDPCQCGFDDMYLVDKFCMRCGLENPNFTPSLVSQTDCGFTCEDHAYLKEDMKNHPENKWCPSCGRALEIF